MGGQIVRTVGDLCHHRAGGALTGPLHQCLKLIFTRNDGPVFGGQLLAVVKRITRRINKGRTHLVGIAAATRKHERQQSRISRLAIEHT